MLLVGLLVDVESLCDWVWGRLFDVVFAVALVLLYLVGSACPVELVFVR